MRNLIGHVDRLLRGDYTRTDDLRAGRVPVAARTLARASLVLGVAYGLFMGLYAVVGPGDARYLQMVSTALKVPLLFLLTLGVTLPSLYVFSALARSPLRLHDTLRMLLVAVGVNLALLASFGPVTGFFTLSTDSYPFMVLLNVAFFAVSGVVGLRFLSGALDRVFGAEARSAVRVGEVAPETAGEADEASRATAAFGGAEPSDGAAAANPDAPGRRPAAGDEPSRSDSARRVFAIWTVIYGIVGAQMGWILRPFVGSPTQPFEWFRARDSHFFEATWDTLRRLLD